jgi:putative pyruvate formate lyase activating enzyme
MHRQVGDLLIEKVVCDRGPYEVAVRGLLVRHLVLPGGLAGTHNVMRFIAQRVSPDTYVNIMDQYRPCFRAIGHESIGRPITPAEYAEALALAHQAGLTKAGN